MQVLDRAARDLCRSHPGLCGQWGYKGLDQELFVLLVLLPLGDLLF
ncbi:hypothetical protein EV14_0181 [Prochlorococcus sp. MIT 0703]|nr:hypothetical protein EV14_0181 [Prochlorococcus sp. MIT 0703]